MSAALPFRPPDLPLDPDEQIYVDPTLEVEEARRRWEVRVAQWRARALAEAVFGEDVGARLEGAMGRNRGFRGLLHLDVPFRDLESHQACERVFVACASRDPVLARVPFLFVFNPCLR